MRSGRFRFRWSHLLMAAGCLFLAGVALYFGIRQSRLDQVLAGLERRFHDRTGGELQVDSGGFPGWRTVSLHGIRVISPEADTLFHLDEARIRIRFWPLFTGRLLPAAIHLTGGGLSVNWCDSLDNNIRWLSDRNPEPAPTKATTEQPETSLQARVAGWIQQVFRWLPDEVRMEDVGLGLNLIGNLYRFSADTVRMDDRKFRMAFSLISPLMHQTGLLVGEIDRDRQSFDLILSGRDGRRLTLPGAYEMAGLRASLRDARLSLSGIRSTNGNLALHLQGRTDELTVAHPRLSDSLVILPLLAFSSDWSVGSREVRLDTLSTFTIDRISGTFGGRYRSRPSAQLDLNVRIPSTASEDFFASLPRGMVGNLEGLRTEGRLHYAFDLSIPEDSLDNTVLRSALVPENFRIRAYGATDLRRIAGPFVHQVYEDDRLLAQFVVGPENPDFIPLEEISPYLRNAVLTCEDPSFFVHHGFLEQALRESLIQNLKERRFARGGSTISMQLVKNVFLNRKKFLARKLEEILIVWLIEGQHLCSKERMFEAYLNLIEWGPGVYGVGPAARYYFQKPARDLDLAESLFLASIVPRPKKFRWYFDGQALKPEWVDFNRFIANRMETRGLIPVQDSLTFHPEVMLTGPASALLGTRDTLERDTLDLRPDDILRNPWAQPADSLSR